MKLTIYHNPRCSKSRQTLALLEERGVELSIIKYLDSPLSADEVLSLAQAVGVGVHELLRRGEAEFKQHRGTLESADDATLAKWLTRHPRVLQRPVVVNDVTGQGAIGRPPENVLQLIDS